MDNGILMVILSMKDWFQIQFITVIPIYFSHMAKPKKGQVLLILLGTYNPLLPDALVRLRITG